MSQIPTSEEQMNLFRLRNKMTVLNSDFIKVIEGYFAECPHNDFTGTLQSYINHAKSLRSMYKMGEEPEEQVENVKKSPEKPKKAESQRKIAKAHRKKGGDATPKAAKAPTSSSIFAASSPATTATVPKFGDISMIAKSTPAPISKKPVVEAAPEEPAPSAAPAAARKRAIRGGGPLGGSESVIFKGGEEASAPQASTTVIPPVTIKFPEPTKDFWTKKSDAPVDTGSLFAFLGKDSATSGAPKFSGFSFGKKDEGEKKDATPEKAPAPSIFSGFGAKSSPDAATKPLTFGGSPSSESAAPKPFGLSSSLFGGSSGSSTSTSDAPKLTFGSTLAPPAAPGSSSLFSGFAGLAQKAMENQNQEKKDGEDEDAEYVPPKAEAVENEEPDAILSSKCSVFKFNGKEYTKLGVGMLHIKNTDCKHSLLIRAATTTGTVWLNALCNKAMKATKVDEKGDRIRLTCPASASEMATMMIRFGTADGAKKFTDKVDELAK